MAKHKQLLTCQLGPKVTGFKKVCGISNDIRWDKMP